MKKKLLIYAHYYIPDVASTGQILKELAEGMLDAFEITVVCVVPSYSGKVAEEYRTKLFYREEINGVNIIRIRVPEFSKSNKTSRIKNILAYFIGAMVVTLKVGKMDFVFSISQPPILGGLLGFWGKWVKRAKYIYNIQDFNPEQTMAVGYSKNKLILKVMLWLDKISCRRADKVIVVGRDMVETLNTRFKGSRIPNHVFINNWIDEKEIYPVPDNDEKIRAFKREYGLEKKFVIMYSGNLGLYYDLENLMYVLKEFRDREDIIFAFVGEGSIRKELIQIKNKYALSNVVFIPYQNKSDLIYSLNAGDVHWCINAKGIKGVSVPSKLYGIMAAGKPVLGVLDKGSEARLIIEDANCGYVTIPGDYEGVKELIEKITSEDERIKLEDKARQGREYLVKYLTKDVSIKKYVMEIMSSGRQ
ncbi:glycosyltransferase family 4 protein [Paenibacillus sp. PL2-23]|uniref:glycosyltransferase family 4 protein n=1 Tax=Paenibacillus sp. PL2-23 TaxID=2100729 RepID=UPI0030FA57EC